MRSVPCKVLTLGVLAFFLLSFEIPSGWFPAGSKPKSYAMGIDPGSGQDGKNAATIKSLDSKITGFGTLMQQCMPGQYKGKRVRMTGMIRSENVTGWAGMWFRVDQANSRESLAFDNMGDRPIKGTTAWTTYEIVLDVPANASMLAYGTLLDGTGQVWFDNLKFEIVDESVPTTGRDGVKNAATLTVPTNLDFETK
jgi:hypothetical protein